jgi:hypothetical protein
MDFGLISSYEKEGELIEEVKKILFLLEDIKNHQNVVVIQEIIYG